MMRSEAGHVFFDLALADADRLCRLPREFLPDAQYTHVDADAIRFEYSERGFAQLMLALGRVAGGCEIFSREFWAWIALANAVNQGNPNWTPYEIGEPENAKD